ncbi:MAG: DUF5690 family protein, partial [Spirosomaceae bacterium]|nr:DUF5690 family protein [Spirosomataceae bacterium]
LITFADYYAYFGSIFILFYKNFFQSQINYLSFFIYLSYCVSVVYTVVIGLSIFYFNNKFKTHQP